MSSENLDLVRSIYADWERGDYSSTEWAHPEIEFVAVDVPSPGNWTGVVGMAEYWRDFLSAWEDYRVEAEEYSELDDERVLVLAQVSARGKSSRLEVGQDVGQIQMTGANLFHVRDGKVAKLVNYWGRDRARRPRPHAGGRMRRRHYPESMGITDDDKPPSQIDGVTVYDVPRHLSPMS
jgi:ketosteroid isomerase-like protein